MLGAEPRAVGRASGCGQSLGLWADPRAVGRASGWGQGLGLGLLLQGSYLGSTLTLPKFLDYYNS